MDRLQLKTPAKINFGLRILNKRPDGYHNLETIFYPIYLVDTLTFEKNEHGFSFSSSKSDIKNDQSNLIIKAKDILEKHFNRSFDVTIQLEKNIPISAGLGGGSSDCAATLLGLNQLFDLKLSLEQLTEFAEQLGADVPFFLNPASFFAESKGERLREIDFNINKPILLVNPGITISTKWAFDKITPDVPKISLIEIISEKNSFASMRDKIRNDFEEIVFSEHPVIKEIKEKMYELGAEFSLMTGTGSTIFGIFPDNTSALKAEDHFNKEKNYFTFMNNDLN